MAKRYLDHSDIDVLLDQVVAKLHAGALMTIDRFGYQVEIAGKIVAHKAD